MRCTVVLALTLAAPLAGGVRVAKKRIPPQAPPATEEASELPQAAEAAAELTQNVPNYLSSCHACINWYSNIYGTVDASDDLALDVECGADSPCQAVCAGWCGDTLLEEVDVVPESSVELNTSQEVDVVPESLAELNTSLPEVRLMVIWTKEYEAMRGSRTQALNWINKAISNAQTAFSKSKIGATIKVVYKQRDDAFTETKIINDMNLMNRCEKPGFCETRTSVNAHLAVAFTSTRGLAGAARKQCSDKAPCDRRFRSTVLGRPASYWTLAHEIGHLFGCKEDRQSEKDGAMSADPCNNAWNGFGYRSGNGKWRDLMSLNCVKGKYDCSIGRTLANQCQLMQGHYGDPNIRYNVGDGTSVRTGTSRSCCACQMRKVLNTILLTPFRRRRVA